MFEIILRIIVYTLIALFIISITGQGILWIKDKINYRRLS